MCFISSKVMADQFDDYYSESEDEPEVIKIPDLGEYAQYAPEVTEDAVKYMRKLRKERRAEKKVNLTDDERRKDAGRPQIPDDGFGTGVPCHFVVLPAGHVVDQHTFDDGRVHVHAAQPQSQEHSEEQDDGHHNAEYEEM